jgi:nondiscriminating glutamyl-tRNA synthetase
MKIYRIAPSPTGYVHLGTAKSWIINYVLTKASNGEMILRIEDTDKKRNQMDKVDTLIRDIKWLGIDYDKGPEIGKKNEYFQSERFDIYQKYVQQLIDEGKAYKAYETPEEREIQIEEQRKSGKKPVYSGAHANLTVEEQNAFEAEGRKPIVRIRVPKNTWIEFKDKIYGKISVNSDEIGDMPIQKSDGSPMYNFCVVIDDHLMGVTDVVRGFGHLSNTPKQILFYKAFGWDIPEFGHFSDILNENAPGKLSKRHGARPVAQYRAEGYLSEAIFNYIVLISCSFSFTNKDQEVMSLEEIFSSVSIEKVLKTNAKFNAQKLDWLNGQHIRKLSSEAFFEKVINWLENDAKDLKNFDENFDDSLVDLFLNNKELLKEALPLIHTRIEKLSDIFTQLAFFFREPDYKTIDFSHTKHTEEEFKTAVKELYKVLEVSQTPWTQESWENMIRELGDKLEWKHGDMFMALRLSIVGDRFSPPLLEAMNVLRKEECLRRVELTVGN